MVAGDGKFRFAIDRGGTFTDVYALCPGNKVRVMKLLSVDPANYPDAPREGIRRIMESETGISMPQDHPIDTTKIEWIRMGTTVATNALLERKGERMALLSPFLSSSAFVATVVPIRIHSIFVVSMG
eukprot:TRINITY_DN32681_c0_g1_i1.p1 TRINITY_DN32681_c0_g1~~TRINITY_DN32681_c0_g1_i1.p1  ORF type:complete len:139 (+),score=11.46 TRINITY_DN32681_c0_g1_i1:37-417(+)